MCNGSAYHDLRPVKGKADSLEREAGALKGSDKKMCWPGTKEGALDLPVGELVKRYEAGETTTELGDVFGVSFNTVRSRLIAVGTVLRRPGKRRGWHKRGGPLWIQNGYLCTMDRQKKNCLVHRARWESFHGSIPANYVIHHRDGNRLNNEIHNLGCRPNGEHVRMHWHEKRGEAWVSYHHR
uniref:Putative homing endonuclease n=1 Tax=viral metagenome TaxID=1070528 RepID=A0A6M3K7A0_9ZZZZ